MKIAIVSSPENAIPPKKYGGIEEVVYDLVEGLSIKKHDVTLFAPGDSQIPSTVRLISPTKESIASNELYLERRHLYPFLYVKEVIKRQSEFDIIHNHISYNLLLFKDLIHTPTVTTEHNSLESKSKQFLYKTYFHKDNYFISISKNQRNPLPHLNYIANIYHGIRLKNYPFFEVDHIIGHNDFIFWIGRISPKKGLSEAIEISKKTKKRLVFTTVTTTQEEKEYYDQFIEPKLNDADIVPIPELDLHKKIYYFQHAKLFLFPLQWEEPFGLTLIESMACGTPVVAFARGSIPEIIKDGITGFIVNSSDVDKRGDWIIKKTGIEGLCEAVERIYSMLDEQYKVMRKACRDHVEKNFTVERMVNEYELIYKKVIDKAL